ncbi:MAG: hypothetical protein PHQ15_01480 [Methanosarcina sp.]|jgi:hypothetical protein|nr:hypothetical protein [Methanosarcina sp.]MDD3318073.1 hypothetical protein [Methanosarcina sp.]MDD4523678.1 hypothetical protein [Methanosarcina sp.]MDD4619482.1 hypothetical protein [Methanosarcina sp.]
MSKFVKKLLGKWIENDKSCCCSGPIIVSVRKINIDGKELQIAGLEEEFEKISAAGKAPENINGEELIQNLIKINVIPEESLDKFRAAILKEYEIYWQEKKA